MLKRISLLVHAGFSDSGVSIALDVFRTANALRRRAGQAPLFQLEILSAKGGLVTSASGVTAVSTRSLQRAKLASVVLVPGFWVEDAAEVDAVIDDPALQPVVRAIAAAHARRAVVCSSCAGAFLLASAGLLDGKQATTAWWLAPHLQRRWPNIEVIPEAAMVVQGDVITAGAVFAQADIALHLVGQLGGPSLAKMCANLLLLDRHGSQTPYMALRQLALNDALLRKAEKWVRANLAETFDIPLLAQRLGVSPRTLARKLERSLGMSPLAFVQHLRVEAAVRLLETTQLSLDEISRRVGYTDPQTLSRLIRREVDVTPRELRQKQRRTWR
jgi:transcriptional regulator GlxA family with amidase domain